MNKQVWQKHKKYSFFTIHVVSLMIMLPWYAVYIIVGLEWRNACMNFYALERIIYANMESLSLLNKQQETKNFRFKRAECPELEKINFSVDWVVVVVGAGRE